MTETLTDNGGGRNVVSDATRDVYGTRTATAAKGDWIGLRAFAGGIPSLAHHLPARITGDAARAAFALVLCLLASVAAPSQSLGEDAVTGVAVLEVLSDLPDPSKADYPDCIIIHRFRVLGEPDLPTGTDKRILVGFWAFRDRRPAESRALEEGDVLRLRLLPFDETSTAIRQTMQVDETDDFESPLYWALEYRKEDRADFEVSQEIDAGSREKQTVEELKNPEFTECELSSRREAIRLQHEVLEQTMIRCGGWQKWNRDLLEMRTFLREEIVSVRKQSGDVFLASSGFLFSRGRISYLVRGNEYYRPGGEPTNVYLRIAHFSEWLEERNTHLIVVPVPSRAEVYYDDFTERPLDSCPVTPHRTALLADLSKAGVEIVDLLPLYLDQRLSGSERLYRPDDPHWDVAGLGLAADVIAERIKRYEFVSGRKERPARYVLKPEIQDLHGALYRELPEAERAEYPAIETNLPRVFDQQAQTFYDPPAHSEIVLAGDSYCLVFGRQNAALDAQLAYRLQYPVASVSRSGSGPSVPREIMRKGEGFLPGKRVLVWVFVSRYFASGSWE